MTWLDIASPEARDAESMPVNRRLRERGSPLGRCMLGLERLPAGGATNGSGHWDGWLREALILGEGDVVGQHGHAALADSLRR